MKTSKKETSGSNQRSRTGRLLERLARSGSQLAAAAVLCAAAVGCGANAEGIEGDLVSDVSESGEALRSDDWKPWFSPMMANSDINVEPAICGGQGFFVAIRNANQRYYLRRFALSANPAWKEFGTKTFASAPTCTREFPYPAADTKFMLAGKATDNTIWAIEGVSPPLTQPVPDNPNWTGPWAQVSTTQYTGNNGRPALSSNGTKAVLTFIDGNRAYLHTRTLPLAGSTWSARVTAPVFPAGVTVTGVPAIAYMAGATNKFVIMVRGVSGGTGGLYWIFFNGTSFQGSWAQGFMPYTVSSDPALEYDPDQSALTIYFRSDNVIMQTSVTAPGAIGLGIIDPIPQFDAATVLLGAPRAAYGAGIEGVRTVMTRGYDSSVAVGNRNKSIMWAETKGMPDVWD